VSRPSSRCPAATSATAKALPELLEVVAPAVQGEEVVPVVEGEVVPAVEVVQAVLLLLQVHGLQHGTSLYLFHTKIK
jgi:hypothetical protein